MLKRETIEAIYRHAKDDYPSECCGIVTGTGSLQNVNRCRNLQDKLHAKAPEAYPRTSREAYSVDRREADRIISEASARGEEVLAFYHSHIDCDAYFSETDREAQLAFGEPEYPDALHVVVAVHEGQVREIKGFSWKKGDSSNWTVERQL